MTLKQVVFWLVLSWLGIGTLFSLLAFLGWLSPWWYGSIAVPVFLLCVALGRMVADLRNTGSEVKILGLLLFSIWLLHFSGVIVPETGFDAVWYHLPVAEAMLQQHGLVTLPDVYQSLNPLFSDSLFLAGFGIGREVGAKAIAFMITLTLILVSYQLARLKMSTKWSLMSMIVISCFQVISWQASSFYVDTAKALWELSALWLLFDKTTPLQRFRTIWVGLAVGASLATKAFSWALLPIFIVFALQSIKLSRKYVLFVIVCLLIGLPYYLRTWWVTGNPVLTISLHLGKLQEIGGEANMLVYFAQRMLSLPTSIIQLTFFTQDYVSLLLLVFWPLLIRTSQKWIQDFELRSLAVFGLVQYCLWWWIPPTSTRYALSGFIALILVHMWAAETVGKKSSNFTKPLIITIALAILINVIPRIVVAQRNLLYVIEKPTMATYLQQFYDGSIDRHFQQWYGVSQP